MISGNFITGLPLYKSSKHLQLPKKTIQNYNQFTFSTMVAELNVSSISHTYKI